MRYLSSRFAGVVLIGLGFYGSAIVNVNSTPEQTPIQALSNPSIEVLALSRGRGVPDNTFETLQSITALANEALDSGRAISVRQETIGLEGETRLCIVFRDEQALDEIGTRIRGLARNVDLLRVNHNSCSEN